MKLNKVFLFSLIYLISSRLIGQEIAVDSEGESVYTQYEKKDFRVQITADKPLSVSGLLFNRPVNIIRTSPLTGLDTTIFTKNHGMLVQASMLNSEEFLVVNNLAKIRPGIGFKIGYQISADSLANIELMVSRYKSVRLWGVNLIANMDNFKLYDTVSKSQSVLMPFSFGVEGNITWFFRHRKGEKISNSPFRIGTALVGSVLYSWNDDDLINYQNIGKTTVLPAVVALEDFEGKYGVLEMGLKGRLAASVPIYYKRINPVFYTVLNSTNFREQSYHIGMFFNLLATPIKQSRNFKVPSSIGMGIDWVYKDGAWSGAFLFLKGTIDLGSLD